MASMRHDTKAVTIDNCEPYIGDNETPLMLLNVTTRSLVWLERHIHRDTVRSKRGRTLPVELWYMILKFVAADPVTYALVQAKSKTHRLGDIVLDCAVVEFMDNHQRGHEMLPGDAMRYQDALDQPTLPCPFLHFGFGSEWFQVLLPATPSKYVNPYLICDITPDQVVTCVDRGGCWLCHGKRFLCDHTANPLVEWTIDFEGVDLTRVICPLCMGPDLTYDQLDYLTDHIFDNPSDAEVLLWEARIISRLHSTKNPGLDNVVPLQPPTAEMWKRVHRAALHVTEHRQPYSERIKMLLPTELALLRPRLWDIDIDDVVMAGTSDE